MRSAAYQTATDQHAIQVLLIDDEAGLIWLANTGAIEVHIWGAHLPDLAEPDMVVFDLDPGDEATFKDVLQAAGILHERLDSSACGATRRRAAATASTSSCRWRRATRSRRSATGSGRWPSELEAEHPKLIAVSHGPTHRGNARDDGPRPEQRRAEHGGAVHGPGPARAPVSTPLTWKEVEDGKLRPADLTLKTVPRRVKKLGDLFAPVLAHDQQLPPL